MAGGVEWCVEHLHRLGVVSDHQANGRARSHQVCLAEDVLAELEDNGSEQLELKTFQRHLRERAASVTLRASSGAPLRTD